jgi:hypothetical protein
MITSRQPYNIVLDGRTMESLSAEELNSFSYKNISWYVPDPLWLSSHDHASPL